MNSLDTSHAIKAPDNVYKRIASFHVLVRSKTEWRYPPFNFTTPKIILSGICSSFSRKHAGRKCKHLRHERKENVRASFSLRIFERQNILLCIFFTSYQRISHDHKESIFSQEIFGELNFLQYTQRTRLQ